MSDVVLVVILIPLFMVVVAMVLYRWTKSRRIGDAPSDLIPTQDEMVGLRVKVLAGDVEATDYWFRGATFYEAQRVYGKTPEQALEIALHPALKEIGFRVEHVHG